jgi:Biotin-lipoyl like
VSTNPPAGTPEAKSKSARRIDEAFEDASKLAGSNLAPAEFYEQFLNKTLSAIDAPAGVVWLRTPQGFLQIACQVNLDKVGLDSKRGGRPCHNEILRQVFQSQPMRPLMIEPQGRLQGVNAEPGAVPAANLTDYYALFAPIVQSDKQPLGLLEIFHEPELESRVYQTFLQYTVQMAGYASQYHAFSGSRQSSGLERVYTQVESFAKLIHGSLNPTEVAYHVANEGRRLIEADRVCVGVRHGKKVTVEAVSGADVVEKASTHVRRMRELFDAVVQYGDRLVYKGTKDEGLPPNLSAALDAYLNESQPKLLVVQPIRDDREKDNNKPARSVVLLESFNPPEQHEPMLAKFDVVNKHAAPALYNAWEMRRIPFRFIWTPISKIQELLGGKARFYTALALIALVAITVAMVMIPYPLKMEAKGEFLPKNTVYVFPPTEGQVRSINVRPGDRVKPDALIATLHSPELLKKITDAQGRLSGANKTKEDYESAIAKGGLTTDAEIQYRIQIGEASSTITSISRELDSLYKTYNATKDRDGLFLAQAPKLEVGIGGDWQVLNSDQRGELLNRVVRGNEPLVRLGAVDGPWRVELKIPQRNIGHISRAFATDGLHKKDAQGKKYLDVDVLLTSRPDTKFPGRLYDEDMSKEVIPNRDDHNESEGIMTSPVRVNLEEFGPAGQIPPDLRVAGVEVHARVRCGEHALGYSLFHGVWEWFYEKVIFFF